MSVGRKRVFNVMEPTATRATRGFSTGGAEGHTRRNFQRELEGPGEGGVLDQQQWCRAMHVGIGVAKLAGTGYRRESKGRGGICIGIHGMKRITRYRQSHYSSPASGRHVMSTRTDAMSLRSLWEVRQNVIVVEGLAAVAEDGKLLREINGGFPGVHFDEENRACGESRFAAPGKTATSRPSKLSISGNPAQDERRCI